MKKEVENGGERENVLISTAKVFQMGQTKVLYTQTTGHFQESPRSKRLNRKSLVSGSQQSEASTRKACGHCGERLIWVQSFGESGAGEETAIQGNFADIYKARESGRGYLQGRFSVAKLCIRFSKQ